MIYYLVEPKKKENFEEIMNVQILQCPLTLYRENHHGSGDNNVKEALKHVSKTRSGDISPANDVVVLATIELNNGTIDTICDVWLFLLFLISSFRTIGFHFCLFPFCLNQYDIVVSMIS